jgi:hypothetical protein
MNAIHKINETDTNNVFFLDKKKNIIMDGFFTKILYSSPNYSILGLFFDFAIQGKLSNNKFFGFDINSNADKIAMYIEMEKQLLKNYKLVNQISKNSVHILKSHLSQGYLKVFTKKEIRNKRYVLKVSGIWETQTEVGITYKLLECTYL